MDLKQVEARYQKAVMDITEKLKRDQNVIAVILFGSLAYDRVWEKSDVDMKVIVRDQKLTTKSYCVDEEDIVINLDLETRSSFVQHVNKATGGLWWHSYLSKGKILFTRDDSLYEYFEDLQIVGDSDRAMAAFITGCGVVGIMQKAEKWIRVKNDATYARLYLIKLAEELARLMVCLNNEPPTREAILRATEIDPKMMERFYFYPMNNKMSAEEVLQLLSEADAYLEAQLPVISRPILEYFDDGEPKTMTMLGNHFGQESHFIIEMFEYAREKGIIEKITQTIRVTPKGRPVVEEIAFIKI